LWLQQPHQEDFELICKILTSDLVVKPFDQKLKTELLTDASKLKGLGYGDKDNRPRLVQCGSCSLSPAEKNYACIEIESLAIQYAVKDCRFYLLGTLKFTIFTDHKPLQNIYVKALSEIINPRLLNYRLKLTHYSGLTVTWTEGRGHMIADALSCNPVFDPPTDNSNDTALCYNISPRDPLLHNIYEEAKKDLNYQKIVTAIQRCILCSKLIMGHPGKDYKGVWEELSVLNDTILVFSSTHLVIPESLRRSILDQLHMSHSGITRTRSLARKLYFWPGMSSQIASLINARDKCQNLRPSLKSEPLKKLPAPKEPMQTVSMDLYELKGIHYLCMCDRYSFFCWVSHLATLRTVTVIKIINGWFKILGYPQYIYSDNGPQFDSR
jgi:hypothetical protein